MQLLLAFILIASFRVLSSTPAGDSDRVSSLPGWNKLDSNWFSGHVYVGKKEGKALFHHYILIESERSPKKDPVIVWSNGGPGAPSLFGLMVELGPILLTKNGMIRNEFAWTREANLIILNGPPGSVIENLTNSRDVILLWDALFELELSKRCVEQKVSLHQRHF